VSPTDHVDQLQAEADYRRQRLDLYRAKVGGSHATSPERLEELARQYELAAARLARAKEEAAEAERSKPQRED
jgi:uncharacterized membrane-anchored protein YhcB (DUF1043 family)